MRGSCSYATLFEDRYAFDCHWDGEALRNPAFRVRMDLSYFLSGKLFYPMPACLATIFPMIDCHCASVDAQNLGLGAVNCNRYACLQRSPKWKYPAFFNQKTWKLIWACLARCRVIHLFVNVGFGWRGDAMARASQAAPSMRICDFDFGVWVTTQHFFTHVGWSPI